MTKPSEVKDLIESAGGRVEEMGRLPDGSGFATASFPLPKDHWLTQPGDNVPPMGLRMGTADPRRRGLARHVADAARYAVRCATRNGTLEDFDPDALVQCAVVGLLGYETPTGLSHLGDAASSDDVEPSDVDDVAEPLTDEAAP